MADGSLEVTPEELRRRLTEEAESVVVVDCREPEEHAIARLEGAVLVPMGEVQSRLDELRDLSADGERDVVVMCHHGVRSLRVAVALRQAGFDDAVSLAGGIDRWSQEIDPAVPRY